MTMISRVQLSLRAWVPNFAWMETVLGEDLSRRLRGDDWRVSELLTA